MKLFNDNTYPVLRQDLFGSRAASGKAKKQEVQSTKG